MKRYLVPTVITLLSATLIFANNSKESTSEIEAFSISLNVKDVAASKAFYEKLGFSALDGQGGVEQKWLIMQNGKAKVGLFQGFFPQNTITINPKDARSMFKGATDSGLKATFSTGMDKSEGPASFTLLDPDGNSILIDQHK
ncbi:VOC family protein [Roseivirga sp. 4D4]|uniref:VOC family protein n=1 Tax=Roseivirga sp. 4D4 TaxID=1889784 RepID=UPI00210105E8|nr:VOC family protein [Roseivirga sp. 4D4]